MSENLTQLIAETASLGWFKQLGYVVLLGTQLASGESAAERKTLIEMVLSGRLCEAIRQLNPATCKKLKTTVAQPATVQSSSWLNP
jgi:hypothetical protein